MADPEAQPIQHRSYLQTVLSVFVPGLGQAIGGAIPRGLLVLATTAVMSGLTIWTSAQRARFPDYGLSARAFLLLLGETAALLLFIGSLYYLATRTVATRPLTEAAAKVVFILLAAFSVALVQEPLLDSAVPAGERNQLYGMTAVFGAALVASIWYWNIGDAGWIRKDSTPPSTNLILLGSLALLVLGTRVTQIDVAKAVQEYRDTQIILRRIVWPWRAAFVYDVDETRASTEVQAPCPPGAEGPPMAEPREEAPWIVIEPNCGELSTRETDGTLTLGTQIVIEGGNFRPGQTAHIEWQNPIGQSFTPRGVGETEFQVAQDGTFSAQINMPQVTIPSTAEGAQIHDVSVVQTGARTFTGELSEDMRLALQEMLVTIVMGMMATFVGVALALPVSFLAARNLMSNIRTTMQGFVGGVFGLALGSWLGQMAASRLSAQIGGLEGAPVGTALIHLILVLGGALLFYRLAGSGLDWLGKRALPVIVARSITIFGLATVGAAIGYLLGQAFSHGVISITQSTAVARQMAPTTGLIGAIMAGGAMAVYAWRHTPTDEVTTGNIVYAAVRVLMNIIRSIEPLILAVIGIIWVGPGPFAGFMALTAHTIAALGKLYSEAIESIDPGPIEAVQATGADRLQTIRYAVFPQVLPPFIAFTIYRWDINVRLSTIIGLVGGGGIGFLLIQWIRLFDYQQAGIAVWLITLTVAALDFVSAEIREHFV